MANTLKKIQTVTVGSGGSATIEFTSIPQTYTDLKIVLSVRSDRSSGTQSDFQLRFNGNSSNYSRRTVQGSGSAASSVSGSAESYGFIGTATQDTDTASVFGSAEVYIPNYTSANNKSYSADVVRENNATSGFQGLIAGLWSNTAAITSITFYVESNTQNFKQYSTATLYGVSNGVKATGGAITADANYFYHTFTSDGTFTPLTSLTCDYLVVAGGGGGVGSNNNAGAGGPGGGAGGLRCTVGATGGGGTLESALSLTTTAYTVTVGAGGAGGAGTTVGTSGSNSIFSSITSTGGGGGGNSNGLTGGSGGGSRFDGTVGSGTANQGFAGGLHNTGGALPAGSGGGAGAVGGNATTTTGGNGGAGVTTSISGTSTTYAGGGGGGSGSASTLSPNAGTGGSGGGGNGGAAANASNGTTNTGGGGGGAGRNSNTTQYNGGAGGSGIVIVRYAR